MRGIRRRPGPIAAARRVAGALVVTTLLGPAAASAAVEDRLVRTLPIADGAAVTVEATIAAVRLVASPRPDLKLEIVRTAPARAELDRMPVTIDEGPHGVRIAVVHADEGRDARLHATIVLELPAATRVDAVRVGEGRVELEGLRAAVLADVRRGPIVARGLGGAVRLETGIGDITLRQARLDAEGLIRLRTFNGDIALAFAERPADARVLALALNGTVTSAIPLTLKTAWGPRWGEATLGRGEPVVSLDVVSGDIRIEAPGAR